MLFHNLGHIEQQIASSLDPSMKGFVDLDDLMQAVHTSLQDPYQEMMKELIE